MISLWLALTIHRITNKPGGYFMIERNITYDFNLQFK